MRWILMAMMLVLGGCIEEAGRKPASPINPSVCGKCVEAWTTVWPEVDGFPTRCVAYSDGELCCPTRGDANCPTAMQGYEWDECAAVVEIDGARACTDEDAITSTCEVQDACD